MGSNLKNSDLYWVKVSPGVRHVCRIEDNRVMIDMRPCVLFDKACYIATKQRRVKLRGLLTRIGSTREREREGEITTGRVGGCSIGVWGATTLSKHMTEQ